MITPKEVLDLLAVVGRLASTPGAGHKLAEARDHLIRAIRQAYPVPEDGVIPPAPAFANFSVSADDPFVTQTTGEMTLPVAGT